VSQNLSIIGDILFIEEDDNYRAELTEYLSQLGLNVTPLASESHALKHLQNQPWSWYPAAIICDIVMVGMGGYELLRRISETYPKRDIIKVLHSKLNSGTDILEGEIAGAHGFIIKPIEPKVLYDGLISIAEKRTTHKGIQVIGVPA